MDEKPLFSFVLVCYNQERFIHEAVAAALSQTYSPLQIVISDDCSRDRTFEIAQEIVAGYHGPHTVRLNRNETNVGLGENLNRAMALCDGEMIVGAAGDDISIPERAEVVWRVWEQSGRRATSISSSYELISEDGTCRELAGLRGEPEDTRPVIPLEADLETFIVARRPAAAGCAHAWSPELIRYFGPLKSNMEDAELSFRSHAIGRILWIRKPLVKYRRHANNFSFYLGKKEHDRQSFAQREDRLRSVDEQTVKLYDNIAADIEILYRDARITSAERARLLEKTHRIRTHYKVEREMMEGGMAKKLYTLIQTARAGDLACALRFTRRLFPQPVYRVLYSIRRWPASASGV